VDGNGRTLYINKFGSATTINENGGTIEIGSKAKGLAGSGALDSTFEFWGNAFFNNRFAHHYGPVVKIVIDRNLGESDGICLQCTNSEGTAIEATGIVAGTFADRVQVWGDVDVLYNLNVRDKINKAGGGFKIDHPLDPANKYLNHGFVESIDMKNIYDGIVTLDANGEAVIELPEWFETLNE
jgi:hypothetical protein